jgi:hypothetical protein
MLLAYYHMQCFVGHDRLIIAVLWWVSSVDICLLSTWNVSKAKESSYDAQCFVGHDSCLLCRRYLWCSCFGRQTFTLQSLADDFVSGKYSCTIVKVLTFTVSRNSFEHALTIYQILSWQLSVRNCFIRGSVVRYVLLPQDGVDIDILHDATRREARGGWSRFYISVEREF